MNNDQQPNISPDYGFIMGQQTPQDKKPGIDKRVVIIIVGAVLLFLMFIASVLTKANGSTKQGAGANSPAAQQVTSFTEALKAGDYQKAADIYKWSSSDTDKKQLADELRQSAKIMDFNSCKISGVITKSEAQIVKQTCTTIDKRNQMNVDFTIVKSNDKYYMMNSQYAVVKL